MTEEQDVREALRDIFQEGFFLEKLQRQVEAVDPENKPPAWMTEELQAALDDIEGPHERKKRTTLLRVAEAEASGAPVQPLFLSPDCCTAPIWYGRQQPFVKVGWRDVPLIAAAYDIAKRHAHWWYDQAEEERLLARRQVVARTQDRLSEVALAAAEVLFRIMTDPESSDDVRRKAAVDVLTHAAEETAPKSKQSQVVDLKMASTGPTMADIRNRKRRLPEEISGGTPDDDAQEAWDSTDDSPQAPPPGGLRIPMIHLEPPPVVPAPNGGDGDDQEESDTE